MKEPMSNIRVVCSTCGINRPSLKQLEALKVGDYVKLLDNNERFWVKIVSIDSGVFKGTVNTDLVNWHAFKDGDVITFKGSDIIGLVPYVQ